jgi:hypothetical protein
VIAVRRIDQFSPQRTDTVVATPSCCCCCCCCCCVGSLTFGGVQTEKFLTSAIIETHPELSVDDVLAKFRVQRILAGLSPAIFTGLAVVLAVVFSKNDVPAGSTWIVLPLWIAAMFLLFFSANAIKGAWVFIAIVLAPIMLGVELVVGFFTLTLGTFVTGGIGIALAAVRGGKRPKQGNEVQYFYPDGTSAPNTSAGYVTPVGPPPPSYNGHLQWSASPQGLPGAPSAPNEAPTSWPTEPPTTSPQQEPPQQPNET